MSKELHPGILSKKRGKTGRVELNKEYVKKRYYEDKVSLNGIAKEIGIGIKTMQTKFSEFGFKARDIKSIRKQTARRGTASNFFKDGIRNREGYLQIYCYDHPMADKYGYVFVHRLFASQKYNRDILSNEHVHHIDGNTKNNNLSNLEIISINEHMSIHMKERHVLRRELELK